MFMGGKSRGIPYAGGMDRVESQFGFPRRWLAEAASTNDVAREWALAGAPAGAVVSAARQSQGRGRRERRWDSPAGTGLYASFILRPGWLAEEASNLAILAGMAAYRALGKAGVPNLCVKWPNDILAGGRKICGVLVEPRIGAGRRWPRRTQKDCKAMARAPAGRVAERRRG